MAILNTANLTSKVTLDTGETFDFTTNSNTSRSNKVDDDIKISKTVSKNWVKAEDVVTISTQLTNNMSVDIEDINIKDTLTEGATFIPGTVKVGEQTYQDFDPIVGFKLPVTIGGFGADMVVSYNISVDKYLSVSSIKNQSTINVNVDNKQFELNSTQMEIKILDNEIYLTKTANLMAVKSGDRLTYTIEISNNGQYTNTELFFKDTIPEGTTFVENSVKIDKVLKEGLNPNTGFELSDLTPSGTIVVEFSVDVI